MNIDELNSVLKKINSNEDFLVEEILVVLMEMQLITEKEWEIELQGGDRRNRDDDVGDFSFENGKINFEINRDGIFEKFPESFFLSSYYKKVIGKKAKTINQKEKKEVKSFLQILEQNFQEVKVKLSQKKRDVVLDNPRKLCEYWELPEELTGNQKMKLLEIITVIKNYKKTEVNTSRFLSFILNLPTMVKIIESDSPFYFSSDKYREIGFVRLGEDFILGEYFYDKIPKYHIQIGEVNKKVLNSLFSKKFEIQLKLICEYLIPAECSFSADYTLLDKEKDFILNDKEQFLGQTTFIN